MPTVRPGQDTVLSWSSGAVDCRVVAAAGAFVLLSPGRFNAQSTRVPVGRCGLTFVDGIIPVGWDGTVELGSAHGEWRFQVAADSGEADRRTSVRLPHFVDITVGGPGGDQRCLLLDISAGGARFRSAVRLAVGSSVRLRGALDDTFVLDAEGIVRTSEPSIAAVEFTHLHGITTQQLGAWTVSRLRASLVGHG